MNRVRCPKCASLRISGDQVRFKCKNCGFIHYSKIKTILKPSVEIAKYGIVFRENLEALVVAKSKYKSVVYK